MHFLFSIAALTLVSAAPPAVPEPVHYTLAPEVTGNDLTALQVQGDFLAKAKNRTPPMSPQDEREAQAKLIAETTSRGQNLRCGDYLGEWEEGEHPYGKPAPCPFCRREQRYTNLWYNGPGSPPSYAWQCDECGALGPTSNGQFRGDHYGAIIAARELWDAATLRQPGAEYRRAVEVNIVTPVGWSAESFWWITKRRSVGLVVAYGPRTWTIGFEWFGGPDEARGLAIILGPLWCGFATAALLPESTKGEGRG